MTTYCSNCGARVQEGAQFCGACGARVAPADAGEVVPREGAPPEVVPSNAGPARPQVVIVAPVKSVGVATLLSFLWCGLGQLYNGQALKGVVFAVLYFVSIGMTFILIGLLTTPLLWMWGMFDAYRTAQRLNAEAMQL